MVTLYGTILQSSQREILFAVAVDRGDARELGLSGQIYFKHVQVVKLERENGFDRIRVPLALAKQKAASCQPCE